MTGNDPTRTIRIVILGDCTFYKFCLDFIYALAAGVGKTSLIQSLLTESFPESIPDVLPEISIPPEISPDGIHTVLVDTSCAEQHRSRTEEDLKTAHVVCIVYAVDDLRSFHRLGTYWLPFVRSRNPNIPVVLVGNKIDTRGDDVTNEDLEDEILPLMSDFKEIETCVECSAKTLINVAEAFYFAQKAVLHPTAPLYDSREHSLKDPAIAALTRIFRLSDKDRDEFLSDEELNGFQLHCFRTPLQREELESIKEILRDADPEAVDLARGVTLKGFIQLHKLFVQRGRLETTWSALRAYGYTDELTLRPEILEPTLKVPRDASVIIGPKGYQFFTELFHSYDRDGRGSLSWSQLSELFAVTPENPWLTLGFPETALSDSEGNVTLEGFLGQWAMTTLLNYKVTLEYLAWFGYEGPTVEALRVVPQGRRMDRSARTTRDTFLVWVLGATGSGKTSFCRRFIKKSPSPRYTPTISPYHVVNSVPLEGTERFLVMEEISTHGSLDKEILADKSLLEMVDAVCYVYDQSDANSFSHIVKLRAENPQLIGLPSLLIATKTDSPAVAQNSSDSPLDYCKANGISGPYGVSPLEDEDLDDVPARLLELALRPPRYQSGSSSWLRPALLTTVLAAGAAGAYFYYTYHKKHPSN